MKNILESFNKSLQTGFVDKTILSDLHFQPELLVNQKDPPKKVLSTIINELERCQEFYISVAFVTTSGVAALINSLQKIESKKIKGEILVSQYLNFTQPEALRRLSKFKNITLRIATTGNVHTKTYIFKSTNYYTLIVGSSNLTAQALATNREWNLKVSALYESRIVDDVLQEFDSDFMKGLIVNQEYLLAYDQIYQNKEILHPKNGNESDHEFGQEIEPNSMQIEALENLQKLREEGNNKALIISATGTGKTYLSAFDAMAINAKKILFVVHRLTIAKDAMQTFQNIFKGSKKMGLYSGDKKEVDCDFIFSTIQTISRNNHLSIFKKDEFDYIIIDETHRSGAGSYTRILDYFQPKFLLGMTATPERTDGIDIFKLFDHNIAYEIRLSRAMEEDMLSPFHYYGVTDLSINNKEIEDKTEFNLLVAEERVNRIIEKVNFYGTDNGIIRGLVFCSRKNEAVELSKLFNSRGFKTVALTSDSSELERAKSIEAIETEDLSTKLDYIFTVDIFNEGIDIPKINQIIMLRPTESAIVFIQQLGRGLRKIERKDYLTIIDFIGNYGNNYLIPIALYGDTSYNKDSLRKLIKEGSNLIPGSSTINFDEITKERIYKSIDTANMRLYSDLKKDYDLLKFKLGRTPMMMDFIQHGSRDPYLYVDYSNSYYNFVLKVESHVKSKLSSKHLKLLELFSKEINNSKRVEESWILKLLLLSNELSVSEFKKLIENKYGYTVSEVTIESCITNLNFQFIREAQKGKLIPVSEIYDLNNLYCRNGLIRLSESFASLLRNKVFKEYLIDSIEYSIHEFDRLFDEQKWKDGFVLYRKYSRKDVFRILNESTNPVAQNVGGYLVNSENTHCPIFVNYHKEEDISESTKYEDKFINNTEFEWMSKSNRTLNSNDVNSIIGKNGPIRLPLFIKKNNDEGKDFYYMGDVTPELGKVEQTTIMNDHGKPLPVVKFRFRLKNPVTQDMYRYLHENIDHMNIEVVENDDIIKLDTNPNFKEELINPIRLFNFYAAAGTFGEMQFNEEYTLIEGPENTSSTDNYFACKVIGESMNRVIPNGSICLFKEYSGGSNNGKIVLVEYRDVQDPDFKSAFTVKKYYSEKVVTDESWSHDTIILKPNSYDNSYEDLVLNKEYGESLKVIGEFVRILQEPDNEL